MNYGLPVFQTKRLKLRPFREEDFSCMRELDSEEEVVRFLGHGKVREESETRQNLNKIFTDYKTHGLSLYAVFDSTTDEFLGRAGLIPWDFDGTLVWEVGYTFKKAAWHKGYATEVARFLADWAITHMKLSSVVSIIHPENVASIHVAKKIGMTYSSNRLIGSVNAAIFKLEKTEKPSYYSAQESAYKSIRERGEAGWQKKTFADFRDSETDKIIQNCVALHFKSTSGLTALDLGTGSGPTAHTMHDLGFKVTGIDVCPSAIELARELALKEKKDIKFEVADVLTLTEKYDLIYDSHCAHCVVLEEDRQKFFSSIHNALNPHGIFILDTMANKDSDVSWRKMDTLRLDENFILWHKTKGETHTGVEKIDDTYWCPQRRIYPVEKLKDELLQHGFKILAFDIEENADGPYMLRAMCSNN